MSPRLRHPDQLDVGVLVQPNVVYSSNTVTNARTGLTNITVTP